MEKLNRQPEVRDVQAIAVAEAPQNTGRPIMSNAIDSRDNAEQDFWYSAQTNPFICKSNEL
jgi:hypothetical protein